MDESCGKCTPCRIGTRRMLEILNTHHAKATATMEDIDTLEELADNIKETALCGLGQTAPNPVLSTLKYFRDEYEAHIYEKRCPAGVMQEAAATTRSIPTSASGCTPVRPRLPGRAPSPVRSRSRTVIDTNKCIKCGACMEKCKFGAIVQEVSEGGRQTWNMVTLNIDGVSVTVPAGIDGAGGGAVSPASTSPPCATMKDVNEIGACRMCVVEADGRAALPAYAVPACYPRHRAGWRSRPTPPACAEARKINLELLLSNHDKKCLVLRAQQQLRAADSCAVNMGVEDDEPLRRRHDRSQMDGYLLPGHRAQQRQVHPAAAAAWPCAQRCRRWASSARSAAASTTHIGCALGHGPGRYRPASTAASASLPAPPALCTEKDDTDKVWAALGDPTKHVVVQPAPAVRAALGEEFGLPIGTTVTGKMAAALRRLGFDKVFDTDFAADLTIMEEATELIDRVKNGGVLPMITSCSPGWIKFCEHLLSGIHAEPVLLQVSARDGGRGDQDLLRREGRHRSRRTSSWSPSCPAPPRSIESRAAPNWVTTAWPDVDVVITTRELARMIKQAGIDFASLPDEEFDEMLGDSTGAAVIFGATGGVMEAALRTAYEVITGAEAGEARVHRCARHRGREGSHLQPRRPGRQGGRGAFGTGAAPASCWTLCKAGEKSYTFIEIMGCPGGCVNGGGQPIVSPDRPREAWTSSGLRAKALYDEDAAMSVRKSHEMPADHASCTTSTSASPTPTRRTSFCTPPIRPARSITNGFSTPLRRQNAGIAAQFRRSLHSFGGFR